MIYRVNCGAKNVDDAEVCAKCRGPLYSTGEHEHYRRVEDECFGIPRGGTVVGFAIGIIIILVGSIWFLQQADVIHEDVNVLPFVAIIFGILIIIGALYGLRRRY